MRNYIFPIIILLLGFNSCGNKEVKQGSIVYNIEYQLPDSLAKYLAYLPKQATVYFKGDSTVSVQQTNTESTTVILNKPAGFMRVLLKSSFKKYMVDYNKAEQAEEFATMPSYLFTPTKETRTINGYKGLKYILKDKITGESSEAWFTKDISIIPNSLTNNLDASLGVPLAFSTNQHGMVIKTTVKAIKFEPVPAGIFSTPSGYEILTPKQLKEMPVEN